MNKNKKGIPYEKDQDLINKTIAYASTHAPKELIKNLGKGKSYHQIADELLKTLVDDEAFLGYTDEELASMHTRTREKRREKIESAMRSTQVRKNFAQALEERAFNLQKLMDGRQGLKEISSHAKAIDKLRDEINAIKIESVMHKRQLDKIDQEEIAAMKHAIYLHEQKIALFEQRQEVALAQRSHELVQQKKTYTKTGFAPLESREVFIDQAIDDLTLGQNTLIEGPTGTGKTMIAEEVKNRIMQKLGKPTYTVNMGIIRDYVQAHGAGAFESKIAEAMELSMRQGKITSTLKITTGEGTFSEVDNPAFHHTLKDDTTTSLHAGTTNSDLTSKPSLKGTIEVVEQLSKFFRGIHEGVPVILDEIDLCPTEVIMRLKSFFNLKAGDYLYPQEGTQTTKYQIPRGPMIIATMNGRSDKHPDRGRLDPAIMRLFPAHRRLGYLDRNEKYDWAVMTLMDEYGSIAGVGTPELIDTSANGHTTNGILQHFVNFVDELEECYLGQQEVNLTAEGITMKDGQKYLDQKLIEMGKLEKILQSWKGSGKSLTQHIADSVKEFIVGATREDAYIMMAIAKKSGLVTVDDVNYLTQHLKLVGGSEADIRKIIGTTRSTWGSSQEVAFADPYEVALLDPYHERNILAKKSLIVGDRGVLIDYLRELSTKLNKPATKRLSQQIDTEIERLRHQEAELDVAFIKNVCDELDKHDMKQEIAELVQTHEKLKPLAQGYGELPPVVPPPVPPTRPSSLSHQRLSQIPQSILDYRKGRDDNIKKSGGDAMNRSKKTKIKQATEKLEQEGKFWFGEITLPDGKKKITINFLLDGTTYSFASSHELFDHITDDAIAPHINYQDYGMRQSHPTTLVRLRAIRSNDIKERNPEIAAVVESLPPEMSYDQQGDLQKVIASLGTVLGLTEEEDQMAAFMRLAGPERYGRHRYGEYDESQQSRSIVDLIDDDRCFGTHYVDDDDSCGLALRVKPSAERSEAQAAPAQLASYQNWWNQNVNINLGAPSGGWKYTDGTSLDNANLQQKLDNWMRQHVSYRQPPQGCTGQMIHIDHPQLSKKNFYEPTRQDLETLTRCTDSDNLSVYKFDTPDGAARVSVRLRALRGDNMTTLEVDKLPDMVQNGGTKETNYAKELFKVWAQRGLPTQLPQKQEDQQLMEILGIDLGLPPESGEDKKLRLAALMYIRNQYGVYRYDPYNGDKSQGSRSFVDLEDDNRGFDTYYSDYSDCGLALQR